MLTLVLSPCSSGHTLTTARKIFAGVHPNPHLAEK